MAYQTGRSVLHSLTLIVPIPAFSGSISISILFTPTSRHTSNAAPYTALRVSHSPCRTRVGRKPSPICCASWSFAWCRSGQLLRYVCYWILHLPLSASPQSPQRRHLSRSCVSLYLFPAWTALNGWLTYGPLALPMPRLTSCLQLPTPSSALPAHSRALSPSLPSLVPRGQVSVPMSAVPTYYTPYTACFAGVR